MNGKTPFQPFRPSSAAENPTSRPPHFPAAAWAVPAGEIRPTRIGFGETLSRAWAVFSDSWLVVLGAFLLMLLVYFAGYFVMATIAAGIGIAIQDRDAARILAQAAQFGAALLSLWLNIGLQLFALGVARGEQPRYGLLFAGGPRLLPVIGCFLLTGLVVFGGTLLLIVPGVIFLMMLSQAQLLVIDRQLGVLEAMSLSAKIMAGNKLLVMGIWIITGVLAYLAVLVTCGLGLFAAAPYLLILKIVIYLPRAASQRSPIAMPRQPARSCRRAAPFPAAGRVAVPGVSRRAHVSIHGLIDTLLIGACSSIPSVPSGGKRKGLAKSRSSVIKVRRLLRHDS